MYILPYIIAFYRDNEITFFRGKKVNILTKEVNGKKKLESKPKKIWLFHYELR